MKHAALNITVGELVARFLEVCGVRAAFGVISIHNMPMLDAFHTRGVIRFVSTRGEAGATNMADACARVSDTLGVCVTSTGTGSGNAAGALVEAMTAGTPLLHLTGQIDSTWIDKNWGFIHEHPDQLGMLSSVGKAAFRIAHAGEALAVLQEAVKLAFSVPRGPVSVEIPIDVQASILDEKQSAELIEYAQTASKLIAKTVPVVPSPARLQQLAELLGQAQRPLLWLGGGARGATKAVQRLVDLGFGVVTSVQGRGVLAEDHPANLGAFNLQRASAALYAQCDAMLVVGSRLRSNETMKYTLKLPTTLYRIDANAQVQHQAYESALFIHGDAALTLHALADALEQHTSPAYRAQASWQAAVHSARRQAEEQVDDGLGPYVALKDALNQVVKKRLGGHCVWVRDITLSNTMWGNRSMSLRHPRAGVHALGGGIGQGLAMGIGAAVAVDVYKDNQPVSIINNALTAMKTIAICGDGGFVLNLGELACAAQERANLLVILMNDGGYGVIKNIQDADYGSRHCYVDLHTPDFAQLCASMRVKHLHLRDPAQTEALLEEALSHDTPTVLEVDMKAWGPFAVKFAGPARKH